MCWKYSNRQITRKFCMQFTLVHLNFSQQSRDLSKSKFYFGCGFWGGVFLFVFVGFFCLFLLLCFLILFFTIESKQSCQFSGLCFTPYDNCCWRWQFIKLGSIQESHFLLCRKWRGSFLSLFTSKKILKKKTAQFSLPWKIIS